MKLPLRKNVGCPYDITADLVQHSQGTWWTARSPSGCPVLSAQQDVNVARDWLIGNKARPFPDNSTRDQNLWGDF